jgi:hypothetical protein
VATGHAAGGRLAQVAAAVAIQVGGPLAVLLQEPGLLGRQRVAAGRDVLAEVAEVGHLADDHLHPVVHPDGLDRRDFLLEARGLQGGHLLGEVARAALGLHGDEAEIGAGRLVDGALEGVVVDVAEVVLEHHLVDPADLGGGLQDLREHRVVATQAGEADLAGLLQPLEGGPDRRVAEHPDLAPEMPWM